MRAPAPVSLLTVLCLVAVVLAAPWVSGGNAAGAPARRVTEPCSDILVLAARGSGEDGGAPVGAQFGATVTGFRTAFTAAARAGGRSVSELAVTFDAPGVRSLVRAGTDPARPADRAVPRERVRAWRSGVPAGVDDAIGLLRRAAATCPEQQVVLVGYGQGAMVLHRVALRLPARPAIAARVSGVVLVADGDRRSPTAARVLGAPAATRGQGVVSSLLRPVGDVPAPGTAVRVWSVCTAGDIVCDLGPTRTGRALAIARSYRSGAGLAEVELAARRVWARTERWPLPVGEKEPVRGQVGLLLDHRLRVRVAAQDADDVRWAPLSGLPTGLRLTPDGHLRGVPEQAGSFEVTYTVHSTAAEELGRPRSGRVTVTVEDAPRVSVTGGGFQSCRADAGGAAWCWGANDEGQLGTGSTTRALSPTPVSGGGPWSSLSASGSATCGVAEDRSLWCWGLNRYGQLGDGTRTSRLLPVRVGSATSWRTVSTGWGHTCGIRVIAGYPGAGGGLWCWGHNGSGQLGDGTLDWRRLPRRIGERSDWATVSAGAWGTCGTTADGAAWCWGANDFGQVGDGTVTPRRSPVQVGPASRWMTVATSWAHTCGVRTDGALRCWGSNDQGQLGDGSRTSRRLPAAVAGGDAFRAVTVGDAHSCGTTVDDALRCWGDNIHGQLGDGTRHRSTVPVPSGGASDWSSVDAGWLHTCGVRRDGSAWCWGANASGQVGDGSMLDRDLAVRIGCEGCVTRSVVGRT